jgi:hypothetical protein
VSIHKIKEVTPDSAETLIRLVKDRREVDVRHGRARLTIARWGRLGEGPMWAAIEAFRRGELSAEELCRRYVRRRVISHTPSFDWERADLGRLLSLVTDASREPQIPNLAPGKLAPALAEIAEEERRRRQESNEQLLRSVCSPYVKLASAFKYPGLSAWHERVAADISAASGALAASHLPAIREQILGHQAAWRPPAFDAGAILRSIAPLKGRPEFGPGPVLTIEGLLGASAGLTPGLRFAYGHGFDPSAYKGFGLRSGDGAIEGLSARFAARPSGLRPGMIDYWGAFSGVDVLGKVGSVAAQIAHRHDWSAIGKELVEQFERALPSNWRELDARQTDRVGLLMEETGIGLAWAPRSEIVLEILATDAEAVLAEIGNPQLEITVVACRTAIAAFRTGFVGPAQTYVATALTHLAHELCGESGLGGVREIFRGVNPRDDVGMHDYPLFALGLAWVATIGRMKNAGPDFNRNMTLHRLGGHHSTANFLGALLLATGLCKELERTAERSGSGETDRGRSGLPARRSLVASRPASVAA